MEAPAARLFLLLLLGTWAPAPGSASSEAPPLINEDVKRTVDLSSHLAKVTAEVVLAHLGGGSTSRATSFLLALEPELEARLAHLGVQVKGEDEEENNLEVRETKIKGKRVCCPGCITMVPC
ncbi:RPN1 isoform 5 [Pan troglodytes]|uniref:Dolichyl-diphosphooligosaccharide--protein glycosyltransferase subunit 1 n=2 Tax=Pan troglodytes TaxID=9598 RepID=A0A2I3TP02_PANTR|nr:RPN1 isoform 5 [Pan troglodytes]